jgi:hypothetical protein
MMLERFVRAAGFGVAPIAALAVLCLAGCVPQAHEDAADVRASVDASNRQFMDAFARGRWQDRDLYADDAASRRATSRSRDARPSNRCGAECSRFPSRRCTDHGRVHGAWRRRVRDRALHARRQRREELDAGKYIVLWKKSAAG